MSELMGWVQFCYYLRQSIITSQAHTQICAMFVLNCIKSSIMFILYKVRLLKKTKRLIVLGLEDSGKTTLLYRVGSRESEREMARLAHYYRQAYFDMQNVRIRLYEKDFRFMARQCLRNNIDMIDGIIYMIDASQPDTLEESNQQLKQIMSIKQLQSKPILILGNKIDKISAVAESYLRQNLGLFHKGSINWNLNNRLRPVQLFMCTIARRMGYAEGFKWLIQVTK